MALDADDLKKIGDLIAASNAETKKAFESTVATAIKSQGAELDKKLDGIKADVDKKLADKPADPPPGDKKPGDKSVDPTEHPEFKKLQAKVREQEEAAARAEIDRKANLLRSSVQDALVAGGADPKRAKFAVDTLIGSGAVKLDDKGQPVFGMKRSWGDEAVPVVDGAKEWLATSEGQFFVPPVGAQGTGDKGGTPAGNRPAEAPRTKEGGLDWGALAGRTNLGAALAVTD